jgi:hypothetical protein
MRKRQYFRYGDIADALANEPESLEIDAAKRDRLRAISVTGLDHPRRV